jgi:hypothetical protein
VKKAIFFLLILAVSRIGVAFAADPTTTNIGNFFLNNTNFDTANVNQILGLLVGPSGRPGPAGIAGSNGFNGLNGVAGMPGAPGPMGATGPQGIQGVAGVAGPAGASGGQGPAGPQGLKGDPGTGGQWGTGAVSLGVCDPDVKLALGRSFDFEHGKFTLKSISLSEILDSCSGTTVKLTFKVEGGEPIVCSHTLLAGENAITFKDLTSEPTPPIECTNGNDFQAIDVNNLANYIGVEIS